MIHGFRIVVPLLLPKGFKATLDDTNVQEIRVIVVGKGLQGTTR